MISKANKITCNATINNIETAYNYLEKVSSMGYNSNYENDLKLSINYLNMGINKNNISYCIKSYNISSNILNNSSEFLNKAKSLYYDKIFENVLIISILFASSYISYRFVPTIFWIAWLKAHENYEVKEND
ncbi:MAG: hypothetical protein ACP5G1_02890 [Nanopusillaceae archaeon]